MRSYSSCLIFVLYINCCVPKKYSNYTLFRVIPMEDKHMDFLNKLYEVNDTNFWRPPGILSKPVDFVVSPEDKPRLQNEAKKIELHLRTLIEDVQTAFDRQTVKTYIRRDMASFDWNNYFRVDDIYEWLRDLARIHPEEMKLNVIGHTYEKRNILAATVSLGGHKKRSSVIIEGGIHAREWISPAVVTYLIREILKGPMSENQALRNISLIYEWNFIPVMNPDGYEYTHIKDRFWRKNRHGPGHDVDLNRNFGFSFGTVGVSHDSFKDTYCGPRAFSEQESKALASFIKSKAARLEYYLSFHSYGQYIIIPYSNTPKHSENYKEVNDICLEVKDLISQRYKTEYQCGNAYHTVGYVASGASTCWAKKRFKVPYVLTFELRDEGLDGFALGPTKILPTCEETMDGLIYLLTPKTEEFSNLGNYSDVEENKFSSGSLLNREGAKIVVFDVLFVVIFFVL